ncbi:hypothetical protein [Roseomonas sp. BN140053]|uniref:hypothetical protein n=1 Tax=Roseomonas sp. BN140053 TaxID=3391898 RepID=UPI0039E763F6
MSSACTPRHWPRKPTRPLPPSMTPEERERRAARWRAFHGLPDSVTWLGPIDPKPEPPADWNPKETSNG